MTSEPCPIAIVGISCLFPKAGNLRAYWANIKNGVDAITPVPECSHWNIADYFDKDPKSPDRTYAMRGGFLSPVTFNPMEFGISPKDVEATDTTQLLSLVGAKQALADAGYGEGRPFNRERTSVILGVTGALELVIPLGARLGHPIWRKALKDAGVEGDVAEDVVQRISDSYVGWQENSFPGLLGNVAAGRIASRLDLGGTNCVVDAACASSLAAVHLASLELSAGLSDMVITGGVDTFNDIFMYLCFSKTPALSPTGDAKPFDKDCDGTILGEGLGILVLKRLADAERDGDRVYAVLKGMGSSSDGRGNAIYAPRADGQKLALQRAYKNSGASPQTMGLIEAHGTGTKVGDATELASLNEIFQTPIHQEPWCALGSVKSQIGHTKAAAGVAGLIKAAMALHQKILPPTIKVSQPIEEAAPGTSPFYVNTRKRPWLPVKSHPRRAGVSALGFGGTNFHCVLEEHGSAKPCVDWDGDVEILAFQSDHMEELRAQIAAHPSDMRWQDFGRTARRSREQFQRSSQYRLLIVVTTDSDRAHLKETALKMLEKNPEKSTWTAPVGIAFGSGKTHGMLGALFPGQGSQYVGMLRDLACQFPGMLDALGEADAVFADDPDHGESKKLSDFIYPHPAFSDEARRQQEESLKATDIAQPALGAVSIGAFSVLGYFGVAPEAACGHSYGELLALCGAGRIKPEALHHLSNLRGRLMARTNGNGDRGAMLAVQADEEAVRQFLSEENGHLVVANRNSPKQFVLAGSAEHIEKAAGELTKRSIRTRVLQVSAAFHSPLVADARGPFAAALENVSFSKGRIPVYANTTGREYPKTAKQARELLANQIVRPVNFMDQVQAMHADGVRTFIEVGPGHVLIDLVQSILPNRDVETIAIDASKGNRSGTFDLAFALSRLASLGHEVTLDRWENPPEPAEPALGKPALTIQLTGANYRSPATPRPPALRRPAPIDPAPAETHQPSAKHLPSPTGIAQRVAAVSCDPSSPRVPTTHSMDPADIAKALHTTHEGIRALQRLHEQTAQLHKQFLEGQESSRRVIQSMLGSQGLSNHSMPVLSPIPAKWATSRDGDNSRAVPAATVEASQAPIPTGVSRGSADAGEEPTPAPLISKSQSSGASTTPPSRSSCEKAVLEVVAEKTGYPVEMLSLDMGMDADLGIDSIKRVEIMAALRSKLPGSPEIKPEHLGTLQTLGEVVVFLENGAPASGRQEAQLEPEETAAQKSEEQILLAVVAEKTGYPVEMLNLGMGLDTDLGIDSIKRVEIMASLKSQLPLSPEIKPEHLGSLQTLQQIVDFLHRPTGGAVSSAAVGSEWKPAGRGGLTERDKELLHNGSGARREGFIPPTQSLPSLPAKGPHVPSVAVDGEPAPAIPGILRQVIRQVDLSGVSHRQTIHIRSGAMVWLTDDGSELASHTEDRLRALGFCVHRGDLRNGFNQPDMTAPEVLVILTPAKGSSENFLKDAFRLIQRAGPALREAGKRTGALLLTVSRLDGAFGFGSLNGKGDPISGGLAGLVKTARREWPEVHCKALDVNPENLLPKTASDQIVSELFLEGPVEVGLSETCRVSLEVAIAPVGIGAEIAPLSRGDVLIVSGGARGVTGDSALAIARAFRPTMVLLGRSQLDEDEPHWLSGLSTPEDIKKSLFKNQGGKTLPKDLEARFKDLMAQRQIRAQIGRLEAVGARTIYKSVDVRDARAVARVISEVRDELGPIKGLVHGAGVLADRLIEDKTDEQFDFVYSTKVSGLRNLLDALSSDNLRVIALFSSYTGRFGRVGQIDYAAANEVLNKLAQVESRRRPTSRVVSVNWGPWNGGMVTPGLRKVFEQEGVGLIEPEAGAAFLLREICSSEKGPVEVLAIAPSPGVHTLHSPAIPAVEQGVAFEQRVGISSLPCLSSHAFNGRAVLPAALMMEWIAQAALHQNPGMVFHGFDGFKVLKGVVVEASHSVLVSLQTSAGAWKNDFFVVPVRITSQREAHRTLHAQAEVLLAPNTLPTPPRPRLVMAAGGGFSDPYARGILFHGDAFHGIERVETCDEWGISAGVKTAPPPNVWIQHPLRSAWIADPLVLDSTFQLMILWSATHQGAPSLPCAVDRYRQYVGAFPRDGIQIRVETSGVGGPISRAAVEFIDRKGNLIASMEGCECVVDAALRDAFRSNRLELEK